MTGGKPLQGRSEQRLLLKKIFEGLARVGRTARSRLRQSSGDLRGLLIGSWRGVFFNGHAEFVKLAAILAVFRSDPLGDRLSAFKLRPGIEETALFAAVELGIAFGASAVGIEAGDQDRSAIGTAGARDRADHARGARTKMIVLPSRAALWRLTLRTRFFLFIGVAVTAMTVLTIHKCLRA